MEQKILKAATQSRQAYNDLQRLNIYSDLSSQGQLLYDEISEFYNKDQSATKVDIDLLYAGFCRSYPKQGQLLEHIFRDFRNVEDLSIPNLINEIVTVKKEAVARELSSRLLQPSPEGVVELMEEWRNIHDTGLNLLEAAEDDTFVNFQVIDLREELATENRIRLWPKELQEHTGGAVRGSNILIFGRPEVGKSLMAINMTGGFLHDGHKVLFIENEDPSKVTISRIISRLTNKTLIELLENPAAAQEHLDEKTNYKNLVLKSLSPGTFSEVHSLIEKHDPDIVIFNQIHNFNVGREDTVIQRERVAKASRQIAKKYNVVSVCVAQAGASGQNKLILGMDDIDFSNTGMPAQFDLIVGVGADEAHTARGMRCISLCKNKLSGDHSHFMVRVDTRLSKAL